MSKEDHSYPKAVKTELLADIKEKRIKLLKEMKNHENKTLAQLKEEGYTDQEILEIVTSYLKEREL